MYIVSASAISDPILFHLQAVQRSSWLWATGAQMVCCCHVWHIVCELVTSMHMVCELVTSMLCFQAHQTASTWVT